MAKEDKYADEMLSDDELDDVVGGSMSQSYKDQDFFQALGFECENETYKVGELFSKFGVGHQSALFLDNEYKFQGAYSYAKHPRIAALGYVLNKMEYPGYSGEWWNLEYTENFIRNNISSNAV